MYYGRSSDFESAEMTIDIVNDGAVSTGNVYPQPQKTGVLYNAYLISPRFIATRNILFFVSCAIQKSIKTKYGYEYKASWDRVKKDFIQLPVKADETIDFDFMESFVAELEAERVAELSAYLTVSGLDNYELSKEEEQALQHYDDIPFEEFDVTSVFDVKNTSNLLSEQIIEGSGTTPYLCASAENNGVSSYISFDKKYLESGHCVFIGGKTFVVTYQESDFYSNDSHNLALHLLGYNANKLEYLYLATCVYKSLSHKYSWGNSISKTKIKKDRINLPSKDGKPDYESMELLISAIQKLVIKDVVLYAERKIDATKQFIGN